MQQPDGFVMFGFGNFLDGLFQSITEGTSAFLGLLCLLVFAINAGLMIWLLNRKGGFGLNRCPQCGRTIVCPHCSDDESADSPS